MTDYADYACRYLAVRTLEKPCYRAPRINMRIMRAIMPCHATRTLGNPCVFEFHDIM